MKATNKYRYRSAVTGRMVSAGYAKRFPNKTVREKIKEVKICKPKSRLRLDMTGINESAYY